MSRWTDLLKPLVQKVRAERLARQNGTDDSNAKLTKFEKFYSTHSVKLTQPVKTFHYGNKEFLERIIKKGHFDPQDPENEMIKKGHLDPQDPDNKKGKQLYYLDELNDEILNSKNNIMGSGIYSCVDPYGALGPGHVNEENTGVTIDIPVDSSTRSLNLRDQATLQSFARCGLFLDHLPSVRDAYSGVEEKAFPARNLQNALLDLLQEPPLYVCFVPYGRYKDKDYCVLKKSKFAAKKMELCDLQPVVRQGFIFALIKSIGRIPMPEREGPNDKFNCNDYDDRPAIRNSLADQINKIFQYPIGEPDAKEIRELNSEIKSELRSMTVRKFNQFLKDSKDSKREGTQGLLTAVDNILKNNCQESHKP